MSDYIDLFLEKLHLQFAIAARSIAALLSHIIAPSAPALFSLSLSLFHSPSLLKAGILQSVANYAGLDQVI